jgi:transcriptional regulator with XRE-family HTH domain
MVQGCYYLEQTGKRCSTVTTLMERMSEIQAKGNMTDAEVACRLGVHRTTWNRIKNGHTQADPKTLRALARVFPELGLDILNYVLKGSVND